MAKKPLDLTGFRRGYKDYDVRAARIAAGLSRKELGAMLGVTDTAIGLWERGKTHPYPEVLDRIKEILNVDKTT